MAQRFFIMECFRMTKSISALKISRFGVLPLEVLYRDYMDSALISTFHISWSCHFTWRSIFWCWLKTFYVHHASLYNIAASRGKQFRNERENSFTNENSLFVMYFVWRLHVTQRTIISYKIDHRFQYIAITNYYNLLLLGFAENLIDFDNTLLHCWLDYL